MKCQHCNNPATVHLTQILNGQMHKMDLCEECAHSKGVTNPENLSIGSLMNKQGLQGDSSSESMVCETCGTTHQEFKKGGRLGCEACYHVFRPVLDPLLDGMHAGTRHLGKTPVGSESRINFEREMSAVKRELKKAVSDENFERAALLRDKLKELVQEENSTVQNSN